MTETKNSRILMYDDVSGNMQVKSDAVIVKENEEFSKLLKLPKEKRMSEDKIKDEKTKSQSKKYEEMMAKKAAEKRLAEEAIKAAEADKKAKEAIKAEVLDTTQEVIDMRAVPDIKEVSIPPRAKVVAEDSVSLRFGVVGSGQAGGRLAEVFHNLGYNVCAINTARQDLEYLGVPEEHKFFLNYSLGGAGKDLDVGRAAIEEDYTAVKEFVNERTQDCEVIILALSGGGGSGSGSAETLVDLALELGKPVVMFYILPGSYDDSQSKYNAVSTLAKLAEMASTEKINSLILVDNSKIELAYPDLSQASFWQTANEAIVNPFHMFNSLSAKPTDYETLDPMDFAKIFLENSGCCIFGSNRVPRELYEEDETALVEAIIDNLEKGLLADGFSLKEAQSVGVLITARQEVLERMPFRNISYIFKYIGSEYDSARSFKGVYAIPSDDDDICIHFVFGGLGLPKSRINALKAEAEKHMNALDTKKKSSNENMKINMDKESPKSAADDMMKRIKRKKSPIGKLISRSRQNVIKRRR